MGRLRGSRRPQSRKDSAARHGLERSDLPTRRHARQREKKTRTLIVDEMVQAHKDGKTPVMPLEVDRRRVAAVLIEMYRPCFGQRIPSKDTDDWPANKARPSTPGVGCSHLRHDDEEFLQGSPPRHSSELGLSVDGQGLWRDLVSSAAS